MTKNAKRNNRPDHARGKRTQYESARKKVIASSSICALCGQPVDKSLKYPDPGSATVDHIIPISRGGDPIDIDNMQLAHLACNIAKRNKLQAHKEKNPDEGIGNRDLPLSYDWMHYRSDE